MKIRNFKFKVIINCVITLMLCSQAQAVDVGIYYYPGWRDGTLGSRSQHPWEELKKYPERTPLLGEYREGDPAIMRQQIDWMAEAGINFISFDWYWNDKLGTLQEHALNAYLNSPNKSKLKFNLLWANHTEFPEAKGEIERMAHFWAKYFKQPEYLRINGKPVVFIFSTQHLEERAKRFGSNTKELLEAARATARADGFAGIYFVGGTGANGVGTKEYANPEQGGYDAFSAYNYPGPGTHAFKDGHPFAHSYAELDEGYRDHWDWMTKNTRVPYFVPMTSGWDMRPWGGSKDSLRDNAIATPDEFESHLKAGKALLENMPAGQPKIGMLCCWNEFGEGSFIEPTKQMGHKILDRVKLVFGK